MTANPLKQWLAEQGRPTHLMTPEMWCARANDHAAEIGRTDIRWVVIGGRPCIEWAVPPQANLRA